eukprot:TRINITY_DN1230_c0_g1_i2.p2 TRINITY_DN1230_c0_g1~~TRINITY_DN1230_c0_g1_i2.p2  ORF type:complete len:874 (+),score=112.46 TRINITY_DN1230_c0_g1_i2:6390-9011(+)
MSISVRAILFLTFVVASTSAPIPSPAPPRPYPLPSSRFYLSNITGSAAYFTLDKPVHSSVIGPIRASLKRPVVPPANEHPRVLVSADEWNALLARHSDPAHFNQPNSWSASLIALTVKHGPNASVVHKLAQLEQHRHTHVFSGKPSVHFSSSAEFERYRRSLKPLADHLKLMTEADSHSLFLCAFWAQVAEKVPAQHHFLNASVMDTCIHATVAWAKVLMAHRTYHCNPSCSVTQHDAEKAYLWNYDSIWEVSNDWYTAGATLALAYDVLHHRLSDQQRRVVRSALALLVMKRWTWGVVDENSAKYPDAETHPHRIVSNWGMYHSNLYITNLAIESETDFVPYAQHVLTEHQSTGFNAKMNRKFEALIKAYMTHSVYPDGSSFEDGYTYHTAFREGSLAFLAAHRRGHNLLDTPRFRNIIHNVAQMFEPWTCAPLVGHSSGGGQGYPAYVALLRYAYPDGVLPQMVWAQRFGKNFTNDDNCRIWWTQTMTQVLIFGDEHKQQPFMVADAPESLPASAKKHFPLAYVSTRRGLIIMRATYSQKSSYMHFDARPDSFYLGHDNADRGIITFSALKRRWIDDLPWKENIDSRKHSLLHVDGLAQAVKAPSVTILKAVDTPSYSIASADLTYTYNIQWAQAWQGPSIGTADVVEYRKDGSPYKKKYSFPDAEVHSPWDLGWPMEDNATDIGFTRDMTMNGNPNLAAFGMNEWRRHYRSQLLQYMVRSVIMVRQPNDEVGYGVLVDAVSAGSGTHTFESYLILEDEVKVKKSTSECNGKQCRIVLESTAGELLDLHVLALGDNLNFRVEQFDGHERLIVKSVREVSEEFWLAFYPRSRDPNDFSMVREDDHVKFSSQGGSRAFRVRDSDHTVAAWSNR